MKRFSLVTCVSALCMILFSCSHYEMVRRSESASISTGGKITAETAEIWTRPLEIGFQPMGPAVEGRAEVVLGDESLGEDPSSSSVSNVFIQDKNGNVHNVMQMEEYSNLLKRAIINAMKESGADGFYITMYETVKEGTIKVGQQDSSLRKVKRTAYVRGIPLKVVVYDEVSYEKARSHKLCNKLCLDQKYTCPAACIFPQHELDALKLEFDSAKSGANNGNVELKMEINGKQNAE